MARWEQTVKDIHVADHADGFRNTGREAVYPLVRLLVTFVYIVAVLSFPKNNLSGLAGMVLYILIQCIWHEISIPYMLKRIWPAILLAGLAGIPNPLSMLTLMLKGMFCAMAASVFVMQVGIRQSCYALRRLHVPGEIVTGLLLMHRYLIVLLNETKRMQLAYKLRAPGQRGLHRKAWGSFAGLLLLRSIDRAGVVYESMKLRGFDEKSGFDAAVPRAGNRLRSAVYAVCWGIVICALRMFPVFEIVGNYF